MEKGHSRSPPRYPVAFFGPFCFVAGCALFKILYFPLLLCVCVAQGAANGGGRERKGWLVLEGTLGPTGKPVAAVGEAQLKVLRAAREEVRYVPACVHLLFF